MTQPEALEDLLSQDPARIMDGVWQVLKTHDRAELTELTKARGRIRKSTGSVALAGALISNELHLETAMNRLDLFASELADGPSRSNCYCRLLTRMPVTSPITMEVQKRIRIVKSTTLHEQMACIYRCACLACDARFRVREENGWHVPTYAWSERPEDAA